MRTTLLVVLALALSANCLKMPTKNLTQSKSVEQSALHYYHKYEEHHGKAINPNVPLKQHYSNEKALRVKADHIKDQIAKNTHQLGFQVRALKRKILGLENEENKAESERTAVNRITEQREEAIKYEINHDEKFRELYKKRLERNTNLLKHALPDQRESEQKLITFDQDRVKHWTEVENKEQEKLQETSGKDVQARMRVEKLVAGLQEQIVALNSQVDNLKQHDTFETARLENELHNVEGTIQEDINLDKKRSENEKLESAKSASAQVEEDEKMNSELVVTRN